MAMKPRRVTQGPRGPRRSTRERIQDLVEKLNAFLVSEGAELLTQEVFDEYNEELLMRATIRILPDGEVALSDEIKNPTVYADDVTRSRERSMSAYESALVNPYGRQKPQSIEERLAAMAAQEDVSGLAISRRRDPLGGYAYRMAQGKKLTLEDMYQLREWYKIGRINDSDYMIALEDFRAANPGVRFDEAMFSEYKDDMPIRQMASFDDPADEGYYEGPGRPSLSPSRRAPKKVPGVPAVQSDDAPARRPPMSRDPASPDVPEEPFNRQSPKLK
jgi:hypothetical protein